MPSHFLSPPPPCLAPFVDCFFSTEDPDSEGLTTLLPDGSVNILFNLGAPQKVVDVEGGREQIFKRAWISGLRDSPVQVGPTDGTALTGISFKPGGVYPFLRIPLSEFSNQVVELDALWGSQPEEICQRLFEAPQSGRRAEILAGLLQSRGGSGLEAHRGVSFCLKSLAEEWAPPIGQVADQLGLSHKHLTRLFRKHVGLNPKAVSRIFRFQRAVRMLQRSKKADWAGLAVDAGFYDQAHMIAEFRHFCGQTPSAYLQSLTPSGEAA